MSARSPALLSVVREMRFFRETRVVTAQCRGRPWLQRSYVVLECAYCKGDVCVSKVGYESQRVRRVRTHLKACTSYPFKRRRCPQQGVRPLLQLHLNADASLCRPPICGLQAGQ